MEQHAMKKMRGRPREFSKEQALQAATQMFGEKGFEGASLSDLCAAMRINRPSMYAAFGNKGNLYRMAVEYYMVAGEQTMDACLGEGTAREGVAHLLHDAVTTFTSEEGAGVCFITQGPLTGPDASEEIQQYFEQRRTTLEGQLRQRFERAIEDGELSSTISVEDLARFYAVMVQGIALQAQHGGTREQLFRVVDVAMACWPIDGADS